MDRRTLTDTSGMLESSLSKEVTPSLKERRRHPRVQLVTRVDGELLRLAVSITVQNISEGGFLITAPVGFVVGSIHNFRFIGLDLQSRIVVTAQVAHVSMQTHPDTVSFTMGFEFVNRGLPEAEAAISELLAMALLPKT